MIHCQLLALITHRHGVFVQVPSSDYHVGVIPPAPYDPRTIGVIVHRNDFTVTTSEDLGTPSEPLEMLGHMMDCVLVKHARHSGEPRFAGGNGVLL